MSEDTQNKVPLQGDAQEQPPPPATYVSSQQNIDQNGPFLGQNPLPVQAQPYTQYNQANQYAPPVALYPVNSNQQASIGQYYYPQQANLQADTGAYQNLEAEPQSGCQLNLRTKIIIAIICVCLIIFATLFIVYKP